MNTKFLRKDFMHVHVTVKERHARDTQNKTEFKLYV